jgi:hypothetical protein
MRSKTSTHCSTLRAWAEAKPEAERLERSHAETFASRVFVLCSAKVRRPFSAIPTARPSATAFGVIRDGANRASDRRWRRRRWRRHEPHEHACESLLWRSRSDGQNRLAKAHIAAQGPCDQARRGYLHLSSLAHIDGRSVEARFDVGGAWSNPAQSLQDSTVRGVAKLVDATDLSAIWVPSGKPEMQNSSKSGNPRKWQSRAKPAGRTSRGKV